VVDTLVSAAVPPPAVTAAVPRPRGRATTVALAAAAATGLALFFAFLPGTDVSQMNGMGLLSVLPTGSLAGVVILAAAFAVTVIQDRPRRLLLGAMLVALVVCLDGVTIFVEAEPRFPTSYQILGYVDYVSRTGHAATGLAAYFSWPGFFALVGLVAGAVGTHNLLTLVRIWPVLVDVLSLPVLFLLMGNLRVSWRAKWTAAFLFTVGNWVGQDYFSPQSFGFLLYLVLLALLVNWFTGSHHPPLERVQSWAPVRLHRRVFGTLRPGERAPRQAEAGERAALLALVFGILAVAIASHQLTPIFMIGACVGLVLVRRNTLLGLPVIGALAVIGYVSFAAVGYWSGHLANVFGGIGALGTNVSSSLGDRLAGASPSHLLALRGRVVVAAVVLGLAAFGFLRRRRRGVDDRVLLTLVVVPVLLVAAASYGGEIALRTYLFMLPAAAVLGALALFPRPDDHRHRPGPRQITAMVALAMVLPVSFLLARYGNEAFEQTPSGELAASDWVYAHDSGGVRLLWLSTAPAVDVTPQMPWAYRDLTSVDYIPSLAPRRPASVGGLVGDLRRDGPGSYLIVTRTQVAAMQQTASYPADWTTRFESALGRTHGVRRTFVSPSAAVYTYTFAPGTAPRALPTGPGKAGGHGYEWTQWGLLVFAALLALLVAAEFVRLLRPDSRLLVRRLWMASLPLVLLFLGDVVLRFRVLS
jgi:hypothetical protein